MLNLRKIFPFNIKTAVYFFTAVFLLFAFAAPLNAGRPRKARVRVQKSENYDLFVHDNFGRGSFRKILNNLENARKSFTLYIPIPQGVETPRGIVHIYRTRKQYLSAVGEQFSWSAGLWNGKALLIAPPPGEKSRNSYRKYISTVIYHEGFHQYLSAILGNIMPGMWFNEGSAQTFEDLLNNGGILIKRQEEQNLADIVRNYRGNLSTLLKKDYQSFYDERTRNENYRLAHALMYYLYVGAAAENSEFAAIPRRYVELLRKHRNQFKALAELGREFDLKKLEDQWRSFWSSSSRLSRARRHGRNR